MADFDPIRAILNVRDLLRDIDDDHDQYEPQREQLEELLRWAMGQQLNAPALPKRDLERIVAVRNSMQASIGSGIDIDCFETEIDALSAIVNRNLGLNVFMQVRDLTEPAEG